MKKFTLLVFCALQIYSVSYCQSGDIKNLNWRIYHSFNIKEIIDTDSDEWKSIPRSEKSMMLQIPSEELVKMETEELLRCFEESFFARHLFLFTSIETYYDHVYKRFNGTRELLSRADVVEKTIEYYSDRNIIDENADGCGVVLLGSRPVLGQELKNIVWQQEFRSLDRLLYMEEINVPLDRHREYTLLVWPVFLPSGFPGLDRNLQDGVGPVKTGE